MEGKIPGREPGVLPAVGHRHDVIDIEPFPTIVPAGQSLGRRRRLGAIALQPAVHVVVVELLAPDQAGERLPLDAALLRAEPARMDGGVELVGLFCPLREDGRVLRQQPLPGLIGEGEEKLDAPAGRDRARVIETGLGAARGGTEGLLPAVHDQLMKGILHERALVGDVVEPLVVGFVVGEEHPRGCRRPRGSRCPVIRGHRRSRWRCRTAAAVR